MTTLEQMFPSLTLFSDLNWEAVTREYEAGYINISFPEYLQQKSLEGDCPPYLFELAYYELALFETKSSPEEFPWAPGIYLNPTALFLSLEFDVIKMLDEARTGSINVYQDPQVICLYRDTSDTVRNLALNESDLLLLKELEDGPKRTRDFVSELQQEAFRKLVHEGLILDLTE